MGKKENEIKHKIKQIFPAVVTVFFVGLGLAYAFLPGFQSWVKMLFWGGKSTLRCSGNEKITVKNKRITSDSSGVYAYGNCKITLVNVTIEARNAIHAYGEARVIIKGGRFEARDTAIHIRDEARLTVTNAKIIGKRKGLYTSSKSSVKIENSNIQGQSGVYVGSDGRLTLIGTKVLAERQSLYLQSRGEVKMKGGSLEATKGRSWSIHMGSDTRLELTDVVVQSAGRAIYVGRNSELDVRGKSKIGGKLYRNRNAEIKGIKVRGRGRIVRVVGAARAAAKVPEDPKERIKEYGREACRGVRECYTSNRAGGSVGVTMIVHIGNDGRSQKHKVTYSARAPRRVKKCLTALAKNKSIDGFKGPTGKLRCRFSGRLMGGISMESVSSRFIPDQAPAGSGGAKIDLGKVDIPAPMEK